MISVEMPTLDSILLYNDAQQILRRAGTPGRAPWNWRAVVILWRPLRLFVALFAILTATRAAHAQSSFPTHASVQIRLGAFAATPLVKDEVSSFAVDSAIVGRRSQGITIRQGISPIATIAGRFPMRARTQLEVNGSVARSKLDGDDGLESWDAGDVTVANAVVGFGYFYRSLFAIRGGVGFTKLFAPARGIFSEGNSIKPLLEAGISRGFDVGGRTVDLDLRAQSHGFGTATFRDNGGNTGNVTRVVVQLGTTLWKAGHE